MSNRRKPATPATPTEVKGSTYWNGLPTHAEKGTAVVAAAPEFPNYWAAREGLIGQRIEVVMVVLDGVNYGGGISYLDDRNGSGWHKVTAGHGSPAYGHKDVGIQDGSYVATPDAACRCGR